MRIKWVIIWGGRINWRRGVGRWVRMMILMMMVKFTIGDDFDDDFFHTHTHLTHPKQIQAHLEFPAHHPPAFSHPAFYKLYHTKTAIPSLILHPRCNNIIILFATQINFTIFKTPNPPRHTPLPTTITSRNRDTSNNNITTTLQQQQTIANKNGQLCFIRAISWAISDPIQAHRRATCGSVWTTCGLISQYNGSSVWSRILMLHHCAILDPT